MLLGCLSYSPYKGGWPMYPNTQQQYVVIPWGQGKMLLEKIKLETNLSKSGN